jgi:glycosyltransferase involved in cell wall biosynthesis
MSAKVDGTSALALLISVVIPTFRRAALLRRCLDAVLAQDFDPQRFEIVVCDDGPDDATRAVVETLARAHVRAGPQMRYLAISATKGPAGARNAGWRAVSTPAVAFTDDDTVPDRHWLSAGYAALACVPAAAGRIVVPMNALPTDYEADVGGLARAEFATANTFVRRELLLRTGGFDERFTSAWREDSDLQFALLTAGATIGRADAAIVVHPVRPAPWGVSLAQQKKSQFDALLYKKYPVLFRERVHPRTPLRYYLIITAAFAGGVFALLKLPAAALCAGAIWLFLSTQFCMARLAHTSREPAHIAEMAWTSVLIPFLSIYWRLYGAVKFRVWFV